MLQSIEILILQGIRWVYLQDTLVGLFLFGVPFAYFLILQFIKQAKNPGAGFLQILPGLIAIPLFFATLYAVLPEPKRNAIDFFNWLIQTIQTPDPRRQPIHILEPLFSIFVAHFSKRTIFEEIFALGLFMYVVSIFTHSYLAYKKTGMIVGEFSVAGLFKKKHHRPLRSLTNELGSADLADTETIAKWTKPSKSPDLDTSLHVTDLRGSEGLAFKQSKIVLPAEERNRHVLIVAKTGGGKTTKLILPILYNDCMSRSRSTIVIDSKPEMWRKLAAMTKKYNPEKKILLFNPLDTVRSLSWNILGKIEDQTDAKLIANTIIMATDPPAGTKSDSPFFRNNALAILTAVMVGLLEDQKAGKDKLSMPRIHQIVQGGGIRYLCDWLASNEVARRTTQTFIDLARSGSQNADTIMSELSMRLSAWDLPDIRATTSMEELDLECLIREPTLFIVEFSEADLEMLRPMANVIVVELLRFLTKRAEKEGSKLPRPVSLVIDEFASALGRLPDIHVKLNTLRSRNISIVAAIQSTSQVKANYETHADSVLAGFSTKIFMPPLDQPDSELASKDTGQMTIRFKTASTGTNRKIIEWFASRNVSSQEQVQQRAVLTPDEIGRPADNICTFFMPNTSVFQGHLVPYYQIPEMLRRIDEFNKADLELKLRESPIEYSESELRSVGSGGAAGGGGSSYSGAGGLPPGITNTKGWSDEKIRSLLEETKKKLDWDNTTGSARKWWEAFENENKHRLALVLRLAEELSNRKATITEFFLAYVYSNTDNIQANLHYLDYTRLKKEEEKKRKEAAQKAAQSSTKPQAAA